MKKIYQNFLTHKVCFDEIGRIILTDDAIAQTINGAILMNFKNWNDNTNDRCPIFNIGCINSVCEAWNFAV
jgi:hypothetical protein